MAFTARMRAGKRVGINGACPKSVRKFAANEAKRAGYDMEEFQDALGHSDISTTPGYVQKSTRRQSVVRLTLPIKPAKIDVGGRDSLPLCLKARRGNFLSA